MLSGAKFPADCTDRADVAAADPRKGRPIMYTEKLSPQKKKKKKNLLYIKCYQGYQGAALGFAVFTDPLTEAIKVKNVHKSNMAHTIGVSKFYD